VWERLPSGPRALAAAGALAALAAAAGATLPDLDAWRSCLEGVRDQTERRERWTRLADSLTVERRAAADAGDRSRERRLLARGEAVADSLRRAALEGLAQELACAALAEGALAEIDARLPAARGGERDSLLALRAEVVGAEAQPVRRQFAPPVLSADDPPEILRLKAGNLRDLADRAERWREQVSAERRRRQRERLRAEAGGLAADQAFFDDRAALRGGGAAGEWAPGAASDSGPGLSVRLDELESWLRRTRDELGARADSVEARASRQETER
jgi:hypothetical protein